MTKLALRLSDSQKEARRIEQLIGEELHETVCQSLAGCGFYVQVLLAQARSGQIVNVADLQKLNNLIEGAMADLRGIMPVGFSQAGQGLVSSLRGLVRLISHTTPCDLRVKSDISFESPQLGETLFSVVRQAARYSLKKANGVSLRITIHQKKGLLKLAVGFTKHYPKVSLSAEEFKILQRVGRGVELETTQRALIICTAKVDIV